MVGINGVKYSVESSPKTLIALVAAPPYGVIPETVPKDITDIVANTSGLIPIFL